VQWQKVRRVHSDLDAMTVLIYSYSCWNYGATNAVPTQKDRHLLLTKRRSHFSNTYLSRRKKNFAQKCWWDLKPTMTVLVKASSNLTNWPTFSQFRLWVGLQAASTSQRQRAVASESQVQLWAMVRSLQPWEAMRQSLASKYMNTEAEKSTA
jgi:hypothetical protein